MTSNTFTSMSYVYPSAKSPNGYVIVSKLIKGKDPVWCAPSQDQATQWVIQQNILKSGVDTAAPIRYDVKESKQSATETGAQDKTKPQETIMNLDVNAMSLNELAALQVRVAQRIAFLLQQDSMAPTQSVEPIAEQAVVEEVAPSEIAPSSAETTEPVVEVAPKVKRKISKKNQNIKAVAEKIEETLCVLSRDEAKAFIKEMKLPIKGNMKCEDLNDAINAYNAGGLIAIPAQYLTKAGVAKQQKLTPKAQEVATMLGKKASSKDGNNVNVEEVPVILGKTVPSAGVEQDELANRRAKMIADEVREMNARWADVRL